MPSWAVSRPSWAIFGPSWARLGAVLAPGRRKPRKTRGRRHPGGAKPRVFGGFREAGRLREHGPGTLKRGLRAPPPRADCNYSHFCYYYYYYYYYFCYYDYYYYHLPFALRATPGAACSNQCLAAWWPRGGRQIFIYESAIV